MTVSVIIYYSHDRGWLKEAIKSVENQKFDGNIDLILSHNPNFNASQNLNEGIRQARGEYIRYLSEDDLLPQYSIHQSVQAMKDTNADFIHSCAINFWGQPIIYPSGHISFSGRQEKQIPRLLYPTLKDMITSNVIHGGTVFYKTKLLKEFPFDETLDCAEEYDLNMKLLSKGFDLDYCPATTYYYRRHINQKSLGQNADQFDRTRKVQLIKDRYL